MPDLLIVDIDGYGDLLTDANFNRATDQGDEVVRSGEVGRIAGMSVVVDSSRFGYELTRTPVSTNEYEDPERQADIMHIFTRKAWKAIFPEAAAKVDA